MLLRTLTSSRNLLAFVFPHSGCVLGVVLGRKGFVLGMTCHVPISAKVYVRGLSAVLVVSGCVNLGWKVLCVWSVLAPLLSCVVNSSGCVCGVACLLCLSGGV